MRFIRNSTLAFAFLLLGCQQFEDVPPNDIAMMLTPVGYDGKIYTPGQVDLGDLDNNGRGNRLVLIQRSGVEVKEALLGRDSAGNDGEDHRCLVGPNKEPMSLDVRLILALPNYDTPSGQADLARLFLLGNPVATSRPRVLMLTAQSVYADQAQLQVRGKIRQICAQYSSFDAAFTAFADEGPNGFSHKIEEAVAQSLNDTRVPLHLVNAVVSNMKPDQSVIDAIAAKQAAEKRIEAIRVVTDFLKDDADGAKRLVYKMQVIQEIVAKADEHGHNTIFLTDVSSPPIIPIK